MQHNSQEQLFITALTNGDLNFVRDYIGSTPNAINTYIDDNQYTPLMLAAMSGQREVMRFLLIQPGINLNLTSQSLYGYGETAVDLAMINHHNDIAMQIRTRNGTQVWIDPEGVRHTLFNGFVLDENILRVGQHVPVAPQNRIHVEQHDARSVVPAQFTQRQLARALEQIAFQEQARRMEEQLRSLYQLNNAQRQGQLQEYIRRRIESRGSDHTLIAERSFPLFNTGVYIRAPNNRPQSRLDRIEPQSELHQLLHAAFNNHRDYIDNYHAQHRDDPRLRQYLSQAASIAQQRGHIDLTLYLSEIVTDLDHSSSSENRDKEPEVVKLNDSEFHLMKCNYAGDIPECLCDTVSGIMADPVTLSNGQTYDRAVLAKLVLPDRDSFKCPNTRAFIHVRELNNPTNRLLKSCIDLFLENPEDKLFLVNADKICRCALTNNVMTDPVTLPCGLTFNRKSLIDAFEKLDTRTQSLTFNDVTITRSQVNNAKTNIAILGLIESIAEQLNKNVGVTQHSTSSITDYGAFSTNSTTPSSDKNATDYKKRSHN